ncbi:hypothetical protein [Rhizobium sp.]|uniref:hypothetical protein n=1 Tax=Rhizobium sp. TaxID=391 RepID=UPI0028A901F9
MLVFTNRVIGRFPLLVFWKKGIKKRRSEIAPQGLKIPGSKNLATSMSFENAFARSLAQITVDRSKSIRANGVPDWLASAYRDEITWIFFRFDLRRTVRPKMLCEYFVLMLPNMRAKDEQYTTRIIAFK